MSDRGGNGDAGAGRARPASTRRYLRGSLPAVFQEQDFGMRFVEALESSLLDPIVELLDNLHWHLDLRTAPPDMVDLLAAWTGTPHPGPVERDVARAALRQRADGSTRLGIERWLRAATGDDGIRVEDHGGLVGGDAASVPSAPPGFTVHCPGMDAEAVALVEALVARVKPVHVPHRVTASDVPGTL